MAIRSQDLHIEEDISAYLEESGMLPPEKVLRMPAKELPFVPACKDAAFKSLMQREPKVLRSVLESCIGDELDLSGELLIAPVELEGEDAQSRTCRLDLLVTTRAGSIVNVEMQSTGDKYIAKRALVYWARLASRNIPMEGAGGYGAMPRIFSVIFCAGGSLLPGFTDSNMGYHGVYSVMERGLHVPLCNLMRIDMIDTTRAPSPSKDGNALDTWSALFNARSEEALYMVVKHCGDAEQDVVAQAAERITAFNNDVEWRRQMLIDDWNMRLADAKVAHDSGMVEGYSRGQEEGFAAGREDGFAAGREDGFAAGKESTQVEIAARLLAKGLSIEEVSSATGLPQSMLAEL